MVYSWQQPLPGRLPRSSVRAHPYIPSTALEQPNPTPLGEEVWSARSYVDNYLCELSVK